MYDGKLTDGEAILFVAPYRLFDSGFSQEGKKSSSSRKKENSASFKTIRYFFERSVHKFYNKMMQKSA